MNKKLLLAILFVTAVILFYFYYPVSVKSKVNGKWYRVKRGLNQQATADAFAELEERTDKLLATIKTQQDFKENNQKLIARYNRSALVENVFDYGTSLTVNKGDLLMMCMGKGNTVHDQNTLMFVLVHELAHIGSFSHGHTPEFTRYFGYLLKVSSSIGIWKYTDYSASPVDYCGIKINATPI